jgi:hypothetical protein
VTGPINLLTLPDGIGACILSEHAIQRWREQVCPLAARPYAMMLLEHVVDLVGELRSEPPEWMNDPSHSAPAYLVLGDFAIPLRVQLDGPAVAVTVISRGSLSQTDRERRTRRARLRRESRSVRRRQARNATARSGDRSRRRAALAPDVPSWS